MFTKKEKLFDCCGARHLYGFPVNELKDGLSYVEVTRKSVSEPKRSAYVKATEYLELLLGCGGTLKVDQTLNKKNGIVTNVGDTVSVHPDNPGLTTVCITGHQASLWGEWLTDRGFTLACNNVKNRNTENQLCLYVRIENAWDQESPSDLITTYEGDEDE